MAVADQQPPMPTSATIVYDVLRERVATQLAQIDALDTKASALLGFVGVLLGLLFTNSDITAHWNGWLTTAVVLLVLGAVALATSLWVRAWQVRPAAADLRSWVAKPQLETEQLLAAAFEKALGHNDEKTGRKVCCIRMGSTLLAAAIVVAAVGLMIARHHVYPSGAS